MLGSIRRCGLRLTKQDVVITCLDSIRNRLITLGSLPSPVLVKSLIELIFYIY